MKKIFRIPALLTLLVLIMIFSAVGYGLGGPLAKWSFESAAQSATGLPVTLESASISLFPLAINLKGIEWPDENDTSKNALEVDQISAGLLTGPLFRGNLIINQANAVGVRIDQVRTAAWQPLPVEEEIVSEPGVVEESANKAKEKVKQASNKAIDSAEDILKNESDNLITRQKVAEFEQQLTTTKATIASLEGKIPDSNRISTLEEKFKALMNAKIDSPDDFKRLESEWAVIEKDLKSIQTDVTSIQSESAATSKSLQQKFNELKAAPDQDWKLLVSKYQPGKQNTAQFAKQLFGDKYVTYMETGLEWYEKIKPWLPESEDEAEVEVDVAKIWTFPTDKPEPGFWLQNASMDLALETGSLSVSFADWTSDYKQLNRPALIVFEKSQLRDNIEEKLDGRFEAVPGSQNLEVTWNGLPVTNQKLLSTVSLDDSVMDMKLTANNSKSGLEFNSNSQFTDVIWSVEGSDTFSKSLKTGLNGIKQFTLDISGKGSLSSPSLGIDSDIDKQLGDFWKKELDRQWLKTQQSLKSGLLSEINEYEQKFKDSTNQVDSQIAKVEQQLESVKAMLDGGFDKKIQSAKEEIDQKLKAEQQRLKAEQERLEKELQAKKDQEAQKLIDELKNKLKLPGL